MLVKERGVRVVSGWLLVGASNFKKKKMDERETEEDGGDFKKEKKKKVKMKVKNIILMI
jgi:hypothetical protein